MPMNLKDYPCDWREISRKVRDDAGNLCQRCGVANGAVIFRAVDGKSWYDPAQDEIYFYPSGRKWDRWKDGDNEPDFREKATRVVLTVAHLDHDTRNNDAGNLFAWCQKCHLTHDGGQHQESRRRSTLARKAVAGLFDEVTP